MTEYSRILPLQYYGLPCRGFVLYREDERVGDLYEKEPAMLV